MNACERLALRHPHGLTRITIGAGALAAVADELVSWLAGRRVFVVTTPVVWGLHGALLEPLLAAASAVERLEVPEGEAAKTLSEAGRLWRAMARAHGKRDSRLLAFGGGSVGDLGGFVAGSFLRGIAYAQLPTTLLAQVDAAIGGKTGVDLPEAKNSVGLFHHPKFVVADTRWLATLPARELRGGLVEAVKMAFLLDAPLLASLEAQMPALLAGAPEAIAALAAGAAAVKVRVVEGDPEEAGDRALLNFGHTLGHALETAAAYEGLRHGEAVAWGMLFAVRLGLRRGLPAAAAARLVAFLRALDLPALPAIAPGQVLELLARDKKARESGLGWVLPLDVARGRHGVRVPSEEIESEVRAFFADPWP